MNTIQQRLLLHPIFLCSIVLLILNDVWWKWTFHNSFTGKLSDFSGLFAFSIVLAVLLPKKSQQYACWIAGLFFLWWKSPFSESFLSWINQNPWFQFGRILDYSDWWALVVLVFAWKVQVKMQVQESSTSSSSKYVGRSEVQVQESSASAKRLGRDKVQVQESNSSAKRLGRDEVQVLSAKNWVSFLRQITFGQNNPIRQVLHYFVLAIALIAFSATSLIRYEMPKGDVYIGETYKVKMPKDSVLAKLEGMGYTYHLDSAYQDTFHTQRKYYNTHRIAYYQIEGVALSEYDTLASLRFNLYPEKNGKHCRISVVNITLDEPGHIQDWRQLKQAWRFYRRGIKQGWIKKIKE